jgi:hypothetical protein
VLHRHSTDERFPAAHAEVDALLQRLGRDVTSLDAGDDPANTQAISDASERYETASAQFSHAQSIPELTVCRSIVLEGLQSTRAVRTRLGLDPGPDPAPSVTEVPAGQEPPHEHAWADLLHSRGGLGGALGAGAAGGLLGLVGGALLGGELGGGFGGDGDWGDGGGDFGGGDFGGD